MKLNDKDILLQNNVTNKRKTLGYLSAAPRVSTSLGAEASGPRAHILGVIQAFESLGWTVRQYIAGDRVPVRVTAQSEDRLEQSWLIRLAADLVRLVLGIVNSINAWRELRGNVDWVYERLATLQALGWIFQFQGIPWILETNGIFFYEAKTERRSIVLSRIAQVIEVWAYRQCDVIVCVTDALKQMIIDLAGVPAGKILVVSNGVDVNRFNPLRYEPKKFFDGKTIGFVGGLIQWHRLDLLIAALAELDREDVKFNLVIVGDGPMRKTWEDEANDCGFFEQVRFVGRVSWDEIPAYISGFDLGYVGNNKMAFGTMYHSPLKLYEYMAMAKPVIASSYEDAREMIVPGQSGYLFSPGDKNDLKRILRQAYQEQGKWAELGKNAREAVVRLAGWNARMSGMISKIQRILDGHGAN